MDDVDRLFQCFKCGISTPESAVREKKSKSILKQARTTREASAFSGILSPESVGRPRKNAKNVQLGMEQFISATTKANGFDPGKPISPVVFYGSPHGVPPKKPTSLLRLLREIHVDLTNQNKSNLRKDVWATFPRQDEAMKFAKEHANVHIFSYQDHFNGQRRFLASKYKEFWRRYKKMNPKHRHHYEVIQEGLPCHLYFDLEFSKRINAGKNGDEMVDLLVSVVYKLLLDKYSIHGSNEWILELDSSTEDKFSRHLIIRIPGTAFKDNSHAGAFVAEVCSMISERERDESFEFFFVHKDSSAAEFPRQHFVDTAVYTRNRCFRLALSSKAGKNSVLLPTGRYKCKDMCEEDMFMDSLICNMDADCEKLLVCKMDDDCVKTLQFDMERNHNLVKHSTTSQEMRFISYGDDISTTHFMGKTPFPALDFFVESVASFGNISGKIRSWYWFSEYALMVYSMLRSRFCERIRRQHKSNHVMYIVDLRRAVYYQKCYDPDCRGYRSPLRPIPANVILDAGINAADISGDSTNYNHYDQLAEHDPEHLLLYNDDDIPDSCKKDGWWVEAIRIADSIDSKRNTLEFSNMEYADEEDESWWMAAEETASKAELSHFQVSTDTTEDKKGAEN